ncbi:helix-turn-helix domain-containing protein [Salmonella enterica]
MPRPAPKNRLSAEEEQQVLAICHEPRFASLPPSQIVPVLADEKRYIASESTFYRVLRRSGETTHRGRQKAPRSKPLSTWKATALRQVWSWDITWLKSLTTGHWFYLYLIEDVFSRKIVGYEVHLVESGEYAAELLKRSVLSERCWQEPLVLRTCQSPPNPCGFRAIRLGSDGEGQRQACCDRSGHAAFTMPAINLPAFR